MSKLIDSIGISILWNKIKEKLNFKVNKEDIEPILINEISFYELLKYSEDKENYNYTEITPELINSIYEKVKDSLYEFKRLLIPYAPINIDVINSYIELDKVFVENEASLSVIINNFVYSIYINVDTNEIKVKKLNNTTINITELKEEINNKVDKIEGKQLSTEDFTTILKEKLEELENYDDTEIQAKLTQLKTNLDTILDEENATAVIDTFQEIEQFLQGITNTETLTGLLQDLKSDILSLCANTYLPISSYTASDVLNKVKLVDGLESGLDADLLDGKHNGDLTALNFKLIKSGTDSVMLDANVDLINGGYLHNNHSYANWVNAPDNMGLGSIIALTSNRNAINLTSQLAWDVNQKLWFRIVSSYGTYQNWKQIAFTDSNVASADKLTTKELTNENLNNIKNVNFSVYSFNSKNTIQNLPFSNGYAGVLQVYGFVPLYIVQVITRFDNDEYGRQYKRICLNDTWKPWKKILTEDDITSLSNRIAALENQIMDENVPL